MIRELISDLSEIHTLLVDCLCTSYPLVPQHIRSYRWTATNTN